jgi:hypothetical protein
MQMIAPSISVRSAAMAVLVLLTLTSCGGGSHKASPHPTAPSHLIAVASSCGGTLRTAASSAAKLLGASQVSVGPARYQATLKQEAVALVADVPGSGGATFNHPLCAIRPKGNTIWFSISFKWDEYHAVPPLTTSTPESSEYPKVGYGASSRDGDALLDFSCVLKSAHPGVADGRGMYIEATALTDKLNALPSAQKREAQVRVLHAASVSVATAMGCSTNLPKTLGRLTPLPLAS